MQHSTDNSFLKNQEMRSTKPPFRTQKLQSRYASSDKIGEILRTFTIGPFRRYSKILNLGDKLSNKRLPSQKPTFNPTQNDSTVRPTPAAFRIDSQSLLNIFLWLSGQHGSQYNVTPIWEELSCSRAPLVLMT